MFLLIYGFSKYFEYFKYFKNNFKIMHKFYLLTLEKPIFGVGTWCIESS